MRRSRFTTTVALAWLTACGGTPQTPAVQTRSPVANPHVDTESRPVPDPDLERPPKPRLLAIDWSALRLDTDRDALDVWDRIAPTGDDWEAKLEEIPATVERPLAIALLRAGNFTCMPPAAAGDCARPHFDVAAPAGSAGLAEPCLRRLLAMWAIAQLDDADLAIVMGAFRAIVAIPPPESQLHAGVLSALPETEHALRLELLAIAWRAGQRDVVAAGVGKLDEAHLIEAATKHHIDPALEILSAEGHRAAYLVAVVDEQMLPEARIQAMTDLVAADIKLGADLRAALAIVAGAKDCSVAASAARTLEIHGDERFVPKRPRVATTAKLMRELCVLASYEQLQQSNETSLLRGYVPARGLELVTVTYDALSQVDSDGDGDPHTARSIELVPRDTLVTPATEDLARALRSCTGTTCKSEEHELRFTFKGGLLTRLEIIERPPCPRPAP